MGVVQLLEVDCASLELHCRPASKGLGNVFSKIETVAKWRRRSESSSSK